MGINDLEGLQYSCNRPYSSSNSVDNDSCIPIESELALYPSASWRYTLHSNGVHDCYSTVIAVAGRPRKATMLESESVLIVAHQVGSDKIIFL